MGNIPLAERLRPRIITEIVGQDHLVGNNKPLRRVVESGNLFSMIFWGPPGSGKTTLARIISHETGAFFVEHSAVTAKKADIIGVIEEARKLHQVVHQDTVLFVDEIHRFNKAQQDAFLPFVENGTIILIGATTENPSFELISPLLSRCQIFVLNRLSDEAVGRIILRGCETLAVGLADEAKDFLILFANGDGRQALNLLETSVKLYQGVSLEDLKQASQSRLLRYDKVGEEHYNTISAFIKSMRASNTDAALYYLARMVEAGEDPLFIARRMVIFASEDIGLALPTALVVANEVFRACETVGYPECSINLSQGVIYLCQAPKDRRACEALGRALEDVRKSGNLPIPLSLRNAPTKLMKELGYSHGYEKYTHKDLLPLEIQDHQYFKAKKEEGDN